MRPERHGVGYADGCTAEAFVYVGSKAELPSNAFSLNTAHCSLLWRATRGSDRAIRHKSGHALPTRFGLSATIPHAAGVYYVAECVFLPQRNCCAGLNLIYWK